MLISQNHLNLCSKNEAIFWQFPFTFTKMRKNAQTIQIPDQNCEKKAKVWFHIEKYVSSLRSYNWKTRPCLTLKTICMSFRSHSDRKVRKGRKFDDKSLSAAQSGWFSLIIFPHHSLLVQETTSFCMSRRETSGIDRVWAYLSNEVWQNLRYRHYP